MSTSKAKSPQPKKGRPSLPAELLRSRIVTVRLNESEFEQIENVRGQHSISEWIRQIALDSIRTAEDQSTSAS